MSKMTGHIAQSRGHLSLWWYGQMVSTYFPIRKNLQFKFQCTLGMPISHLLSMSVSPGLTTSIWHSDSYITYIIHSSFFHHQLCWHENILTVLIIHWLCLSIILAGMLHGCLRISWPFWAFWSISALPTGAMGLVAIQDNTCKGEVSLY